MTHEQACREAAAFYQSLAAVRHEQYRCSVDEGDNSMATCYSIWAAEFAAIARALMGIDGGEE